MGQICNRQKRAFMSWLAISIFKPFWTVAWNYVCVHCEWPGMPKFRWLLLVFRHKWNKNTCCFYHSDFLRCLWSSMSATLYIVTEVVDEFILGFDWLHEDNCEWLFPPRHVTTCDTVRHTTCVAVSCGLSVPLHSRESWMSVYCM